MGAGEMSISVRSYMLRLLVGVWGVLLACNVQAAFEFGAANEATIFSAFTIDCNRGGPDSRCALGGNSDSYINTTPFLQELVFIDGNTYYHSVVGDPNSDFLQEVYIRTAGCCYPNNNPLSASNFNGDGNPTRVAMRTMVQDAELTQWFTKDLLEFKPLITQSIETSELLLNFEADMSAINYSTLATPGDVAINLQLLQDAFTDAGNYDSTIIPDFFSDNANVVRDVTAGRYTYTPGTGNGGSAGTYIYSDGGGYVQYRANEHLFRDPALNPNPNSQVAP